MAKKKKEGNIRCLVHRTYLRSGSSKTSVQGIRVDIMGSQKVELDEIAERIGFIFAKVFDFGDYKLTKGLLSARNGRTRSDFFKKLKHCLHPL